MMIKDPQQLLVAAEVLKVANELRQKKFEEAKARDPQLHPVVWGEQNSPLDFVEQAYRNLVAVAWKITSVQSADDSAAAMKRIDDIVDKVGLSNAS